MKPLLIILILLALSCSTIQDGVQANYALYHLTKALIVIEEEKPNKLTVANPQYTRYYKLRDKTCMLNPGDTIITKDNLWVFAEIRFIHSKQNVKPELPP